MDEEEECPSEDDEEVLDGDELLAEDVDCEEAEEVEEDDHA